MATGLVEVKSIQKVSSGEVDRVDTNEDELNLLLFKTMTVSILNIFDRVPGEKS